MLTARLDNREKQLSSSYIRKTVKTAQAFLTWLSIFKPGYKALRPEWLATVKSGRLPENSKDHEYVSLEDIRDLAAAPVETLREQRVKAAAVFLFLTGIRVGAFVTLSLQAIDLENWTVKQWPELGVKTKFSKVINSNFLPLDDLRKIILEWDELVRNKLSTESFWFAPFSPDMGTFDPRIKTVGTHRTDRVRKDLRAWQKRVGLPFYSPHKFRHGNAVYALKRAKDIADLKAVSQNLGHSNISITDGTYARLASNDVQDRIESLGEIIENTNFPDDVIERIAEQVAKKLKS
jgi:integrase